MSIASTDLILYGAASRPTDDVSTSGGAISAVQRPTFTDIAATDNVEILSANGADTTQVLTLTGRKADGSFATENMNLNGTTVVTSSNQYERILSASLNSNAAGIVTVRRATGDTLIGTIPAGERGFYALFIKSASSTGAVDRFEKIFWKNTHGTLTLNAAQVTLTADPSARITIALTAAKDDSTSVANRVTTTGLSFTDDGVALNVPGTTLEAGSAIGVWIDQGLLSNDAAFKSSFTTQLSGTSV